MHSKRTVRPLLLSCILAVGMVGISVFRSAAAQTPGALWQGSGRVTVTTSKDRKFAYITLAPKRINEPLAAAYVVQYASDTQRPIDFSGQARLSASAFALEVKPQHTGGWIFELSEYRGPKPVGLKVVRDLAGLLRFDTQSLTAAIRPFSHADFVARAHAAIRKTVQSGLDACRSGGVGAIAATLHRDLAVHCSAGFFACSNRGGCACLPAPHPARRAPNGRE